jgi:hypothetical protein
MTYRPHHQSSSCCSHRTCAELEVFLARVIGSPWPFDIHGACRIAQDFEEVRFRRFASRVGVPACLAELTPNAYFASFVVGDSKRAITLALSSADASPLNGFILFPGTICSGLAMKRSSFSSSQMKSAPFIALEYP